MIDFSINIGVIIQTALFVGGGLVAFGMLRRSVLDMENEMVELKKDQKDLAKALALVAVQDTRLNRIEQDIRDLRYGRGYILADGPRGTPSLIEP